MSKINSNDMDRRPKRRKDKYNPYTIFSIGIETDTPHFYVSFRDAAGEQIRIEIRKEIFELLNLFELEDLSYLNEIDRHYEHLELTEKELMKRGVHIIDLPEDRFQYDDLYDAINKLSNTQRRRLMLYYFEDLSLDEIAMCEGTSVQAISKSIIIAEKKLKRLLQP